VNIMIEIDRIMYKIGVHGKPFMEIDGEWVRSQKTVAEIQFAIDNDGKLPPESTKKGDTLTRRKLKEFLKYDDNLGVFTWVKKCHRRMKVGEIAGNITAKGFISIHLNGVRYMAARLAWLYVKGELPEGRLFFRNGNPKDLRFCNLSLNKVMK